MARAWDLHTIRGLAVTGAMAGMTLAVGAISWELWRKGVDPGVANATLDLDLGRPAPELNGLDGASVEDLRARQLVFPVAGVQPRSLMDTFGDARAGGRRQHRAVDILAPRRTPVRAVEDGTVARLETSASGGISVYQFDAAERYCYYYAHLDGYAPGLSQGDKVTRGQLLGYVGSTGNASATAPHLHFAIYRLSETKQWRAGSALNPYPVFR